MFRTFDRRPKERAIRRLLPQLQRRRPNRGGHRPARPLVGRATRSFEEIDQLGHLLALLVTRTLLGAPGTATSNKNATSNKST